MIVIDDKIVSEDVIDVNFVCNLNKCKGACCWEGDYGAPLESSEINDIDDHLEEIMKYLPEEAREKIRSEDFHKPYNNHAFIGTNILPNGACVFLNTDEEIARCEIEKAHAEGRVPVEKPISCHLYPIRIKEDENTGITLINYDKWDICGAACNLGDEMKVPVYQFAEAALVRKYGQDFYDQLDATVQHIRPK